MRLIDADELLQDNTYEWFDDWGNYTNAGEIISNAPTVDAVEIVRCKDCKYWKIVWGEVHACLCARGMLYTKENEYCSHGRKKKKGIKNV